MYPKYQAELTINKGCPFNSLGKTKIIWKEIGMIQKINKQCPPLNFWGQQTEIYPKED